MATPTAGRARPWPSRRTAWCSRHTRSPSPAPAAASGGLAAHGARKGKRLHCRRFRCAHAAQPVPGHRWEPQRPCAGHPPRPTRATPWSPRAPTPPGRSACTQLAAAGPRAGADRGPPCASGAPSLCAGSGGVHAPRGERPPGGSQGNDLDPRKHRAHHARALGRLRGGCGPPRGRAASAVRSRRQPTGDMPAPGAASGWAGTHRTHGMHPAMQRHTSPLGSSSSTAAAAPPRGRGHSFARSQSGAPPMRFQRGSRGRLPDTRSKPERCCRRSPRGHRPARPPPAAGRAACGRPRGRTSSGGDPRPASGCSPSTCSGRAWAEAAATPRRSMAGRAGAGPPKASGVPSVTGAETITCMWGSLAKSPNPPTTPKRKRRLNKDTQSVPKHRTPSLRRGHASLEWGPHTRSARSDPRLRSPCKAERYQTPVVGASALCERPLTSGL